MAEEIKIVVNLDAMTFGDMELLGSGKAPVSDMIAILDRVVVGGVRHLPLTAMKSIMDAIKAETEKLANPEDSTGKN